MNVYEILAERGEVVDKMRALLNSAEDDTRDLSKAEQAEYDGLNAKQEKLKARADRLKTSDELDSEMNQLADTPHRPSVAGASSPINSGWRDTRSGKVIPVYGSKDKIMAPPKSDGSPDFGDMIQAMYPSLNLGGSPRNALQVGTDSEGGYITPEYWEAVVIQRMREKMRVMAAGASTIILPSGTFHIARVATEPVPTWRPEEGAVTEGMPSFEQATFEAKSLDILVKASIELVEDGFNVNDIIMDILASSMAQELDRVAMFGTGSGQPTGIVNQAILEHDMGTNGAALTGYTDVLSSLQLLAENNSEEPTAAIMAPRTYFGLEGMVDSNNQPLRKPGAVDKVPFLQTQKVPIDDTHGTATDASTIIVGDYSKLLIGIRTGIELMRANELYRVNGQVGFFARMRVDIQLAQPKAFCKITGITP